MSKDVANRIKSVAANIRLIRESKGYTQEYLAMKLGISQNAYSKIELGYTKITLERLFHVARLLETDVLQLLEDQSSEKADPEPAERPRAASM